MPTRDLNLFKYCRKCVAMRQFIVRYDTMGIRRNLMCDVCGAEA